MVGNFQGRGRFNARLNRSIILTFLTISPITGDPLRYRVKTGPTCISVVTFDGGGSGAVSLNLNTRSF